MAHACVEACKSKLVFVFKECHQSRAHAVAHAVLLQFSSWVALFSSLLLFVPHLLSWGPFPMLTIIIFLFWDPSHSPYMPFNPYAVPYVYYYWTGGTLCLSLLSHGRLLLQPILSYLLHTPLIHPSFHDVP